MPTRCLSALTSLCLVAGSLERLAWLDSCGVPVDVAVDTLLDYNPQATHVAQQHERWDAGCTSGRAGAFSPLPRAGIEKPVLSWLPAGKTGAAGLAGVGARSGSDGKAQSRSVCRGAGQEKESLGEFFSHTPLVLIDGDPQLARIQGSVAALGARDVDEEAREEEEEVARGIRDSKAILKGGGGEPREARFSMARSLIDCGLVEQGEKILRELNLEMQDAQGPHLSWTGRVMTRGGARSGNEAEGRASGIAEVETKPRFISKSNTAALFEKLFAVKGPGGEVLAGDLERERREAQRITRKEVEGLWHASVNSSALRQTLDMMKLQHNPPSSEWGSLAHAKGQLQHDAKPSALSTLTQQTPAEGYAADHDRPGEQDDHAWTTDDTVKRILGRDLLFVS